MIYDLLPTLSTVPVYFSFKFHATAKSELDLDPNPGIRILIRIEVKSWIRIRIKTNTYPQNWSGQQNDLFNKHLTSMYFKN